LVTAQTVLQNHRSNLSDLVRLGIAALPLNINHLFHPGTPENVMAPLTLSSKPRLLSSEHNSLKRIAASAVPLGTRRSVLAEFTLPL
jgi:hypothetical protein